MDSGGLGRCGPQAEVGDYLFRMSEWDVAHLLHVSPAAFSDENENGPRGGAVP